MGKSKRLSCTPDPHSPSFITDLPYAAELEEVCSSLGLSLLELYPKPTSGPHSLLNIHMQHSEELRKAKVDIVRKEFTKRLQIARPVTPLREKSPLVGVELWQKRLEKATEREETERRVRGNLHKLKERDREIIEERTKIEIQREEKRRNDRRAVRADFQAKVSMNQSHRSAILLRSRKALEQAGLQALQSPSPPLLPRCSPSPPLPAHPSPIPTATVCANPALEDRIQTQLEGIELRLARGLQRAAAAKQAKSQSSRLKRDTIKEISKEEEWGKHTEVLRRLLYKSQQHTRNKDTPTAAKSRPTTAKTTTKAVVCAELEKKITEKEKEHEEYAQKLKEMRESERIRKMESKKVRLDELKSTQKQLHNANFAQKDRILENFRLAEAQITQIQTIKQRLEALRQHADLQLRLNQSSLHP
jgi:hypothetical protein